MLPLGGSCVSFDYSGAMNTVCLALLASVSLFAQDGVLGRIANHASRFETISRQIWETPELGFHENQSSGLLQEALRTSGFTVKAGLARMPTAFVAEFGSGKPVIGLMGEFDALPGLSQKESAVRSPVKEGAPGHGCGHNLLGSASALAAVAIKEEMQARGLKGTIRYFGTPAEEGGAGKVYLIHAGLFRDVDAVLDWHPSSSNRVHLGSNMAILRALFRFRGTAAHAAAAPDLGRSALDGVLIMLNAVELLREHIPQDARVHYVITKGGSAPNIVPALAEVRLMARHPDASVLNGVWERIVKCAQAGALGSETTVEVDELTGSANILNNEILSGVLGRALQKAGGYAYTAAESAFVADIQKTLVPVDDWVSPEIVTVDKSAPQGMASTDAGDVSWNVPYANMTAATFAPGARAHTWQATACAGSSIGRKGMLVAARTLALGAIELLEQPDEVSAARAAFEKRLAGRKWTTPIPSDAKPMLDYAVR